MIKQLALFTTIVFLSFSLNACNKEPEEDFPKKTINEEAPQLPNKTRIKSADAITIVNPRIRALPPSQKVTAMYMQLNNASDTTRDLVRIESSISNMIELHTHTNNDGVMHMGQVESISVPANGSIEAKPGSYHVMIMGLKKSLHRGDHVDFKLFFKDGSNQSISAEVKDIEVH